MKKSILSLVMTLLSIAMFSQLQYQCQKFDPTTYGGVDGKLILTAGHGQDNPITRICSYDFVWSNGIHDSISILDTGNYPNHTIVRMILPGLIAGQYSCTITDGYTNRLILGVHLIQPLLNPPQSSGMYADIKTGVAYDFTTAGLKTDVAKGTLTSIPNDLIGLTKTSLKGATSGKVDLRYNNGLTRWIKAQRL
jgi:hypothetical protein